MYAFNVMKCMVTNFAMEYNAVFQLVVFCTTVLGALGAVNSYTSQCLLSGNTFYEKIFSIVYCLMAFSVIVTLIDFMKCAIYLCFQGYVLSKYLKRTKFNAFFKQLNADLYFIILIVSSNVNISLRVN